MASPNIYNLIVEVRPECYVDDDCGYSDICYKGSCADACRLSQCGANAKCESSLHSAKCLCLPGYTGNPRSACTLCKSSNYFYRIGKPIPFYIFYSMSFCMNTKSMFSIIVGLPTAPVLSVGCLQNEDCPLYTACQNTKCINPCAEDNPCAPTAICKVLNHEPKCTCPDGYIGSPLTDCRPRKLPPHWFESLHVCNHHISIIKTMTNHDLVYLNRNNHNRTSLCYTQFLA